MTQNKPVALIILDGWGFRDVIEGNAVRQANTPNLDFWRNNVERSLLLASGEAVGLTADQMGNSEVGHLNIGAGRVVYQDISRIDRSINNGEFFQNNQLVSSFKSLQNDNNKLHLIGLVGPGGVHSHTHHLFALIKLAEMYAIQPIIHVITDGRDTPPNSAADFVKELENFALEHHAVIGTVSGRYYAMDRDKRWDRTKLAYDAYVHGKGLSASSAYQAVRQSYDINVSDEFIKPTIITGNTPRDLAIKSGDTLLFFNFRADRMRQIVKSFIDENFSEFQRGNFIPDLKVLTFTEYDSEFNVNVIFSKANIQKPLAEVISENGLSQFHAAETEKYAHVTFFFNGGREEPFPGEERLLIPSPKVSTYDLQPEMSAYNLTDEVVSRLMSIDDDLLILNYANLDMVGHTGVLNAGIQAAAVVDECLGKVVNAIIAKGGIALITADHGNAELMYDHIRDEPHTYHTTNPVQLFIISDQYYRLRPSGSLQDIAPTILEIMNIPQPDLMTGRSLIEEAK